MIQTILYFLYDPSTTAHTIAYIIFCIIISILPKLCEKLNFIDKDRKSYVWVDYCIVCIPAILLSCVLIRCHKRSISVYDYFTTSNIEEEISYLLIETIMIVGLPLFLIVSYIFLSIMAPFLILGAPLILLVCALGNKAF